MKNPMVNMVIMFFISYANHFITDGQPPISSQRTGRCNFISDFSNKSIGCRLT